MPSDNCGEHKSKSQKLNQLRTVWIIMSGVHSCCCVVGWKGRIGNIPLYCTVHWAIDFSRCEASMCAWFPGISILSSATRISQKNPSFFVDCDAGLCHFQVKRGWKRRAAIFFSVSQNFQMYPPQCEHIRRPWQVNKEYELLSTA